MHREQNELDPRKPSLDIRWPVDFSPRNADLFVCGEIDIQAPVQRVWRHLVEAVEWPNWYEDAQNVSVRNDLEGLIQEGAVIVWSTFGRPLLSSVIEFSPYSRVGWISYTPGYTPEWYHTWCLTSIGTGCHIAMAEVGKGPNAIKGHEHWLQALKQHAET